MLTKDYLINDIYLLFRLAADANCDDDFAELRQHFTKIHNDMVHYAETSTRSEFAGIAALVTKGVLASLERVDITAPPPWRTADAQSVAYALTTKMAEGKDAPASLPFYHSYAHSIDVALMAAVLGVVHHRHTNGRFSRNDIKDLYIAGLMHDFGHPGGSNDLSLPEPIYFEFENRALRVLYPLLQRSHYSNSQQGMFLGMVRATEPTIGVSLSHLKMQNAGFLRTKTERRPFDEKAYAEHPVRAVVAFYNLLSRPRTVEMAYILSKADIAVSLFSVHHFMAGLNKLQREYTASGNPVKFIDETGNPTPATVTTFFTNIVRLPERGFLIPAIESVLGSAARDTQQQAYKRAGLTP